MVDSKDGSEVGNEAFEKHTDKLRRKCALLHVKCIKPLPSFVRKTLA
jgi:hypothetical protein